MTAIATPGHAPAHHAYAVADRRRGTEEPWLVFTGDSLLIGDVGRPDLHVAGDAAGQARLLLEACAACSSCPITSSSTRATSVGRSAAEAFPGTRSRRSDSSAAQPDARFQRCRRFVRELLADAPTPPANQEEIIAANRSGRIAARARHAVRLGLRANAGQFALLVALNALVGAMVGLERSVLPLVGEQDFGLTSTTTILAFVVAFGAAKALTNLAAGDLAERLGRKRLLVIGWLVAPGCRC